MWTNFYDQLKKFLHEKAADDQGQWVISNPCFEMWLYYCFNNNPEADLQCLTPLSANKRSKRLKKLGPTLVSGGLNPVLAFEKMPEGIEHSILHYAEDENGVPVLFATQVHKMAQYIVETMNAQEEEYTNYVKAKAEFRDSMRKTDSYEHR